MAAATANPQVVQVSHLLDERGLSAFHIKLIVWSLFIVFIDGYDIGAAAFAAPELIKEWHVTRPALGPMLASSVFGILIGSGVFGWVGDRYGRRLALVCSMLLFGIVTVMAAYATNLDQLWWLRLIAGIGIGGVIPNIVAINTESAPRSLRAILPLIAVSFVPLGGAIPGAVSWLLVPHYGWPILFMIGGIAPIVVAIAAFFFMPESIKYMTLHEKHRRPMEALIQEISPGYRIPAGAQFVIEDERQFKGFSPDLLFHNGLHIITPLLWLLFILNLMGYFFIQSWTPTLLAAAGVPTAGLIAATVVQIGGTIGGLTLSRFIGRYSFLAIAIMFIPAVPAVALIGYTGTTSELALMVVSFFAGFFVLGIQSGINVAGAQVYPTSLRANGSGWQLGLGRFGAILGPLLGGVFSGLPVQQLYVWSSLPFAVACVVCFAIYRLNEARLREQSAVMAGQPVAAE
jgi:MFS transporter, AAHS family, 4-hydroxybenzoate transporter